MRKLILFLLLTLFIKEGYSQNGWFAQSVPGNLLNDIQFLNPQLGFACGSNGKYATTTDGGTSWAINSVGDSTISLNDINFINQNTGWISGYKYNGFPIMPYRFYLYSTTNGGTNWQLRSQSDGNVFDADIYMINKDSLIIAYTGASDFGSAGGLANSFNGGVTFNQTNVQGGPQFYSLQFLNKNTGWVIACYDSDTGPYFNWIYRTNNSGANWTQVYKDSIQPPRLLSSFFVNENTGFLSSRNGKFASTTNGGANWTFRNAGTTIYTLYFFNENTGYAGVENSSHDSSGLKRTTNGGASWFSMTNSLMYAVGKIIFVNDLTGWAVGNSTNGVKLMKTVSGGLTSVNPFGSTVPDNFSLSQNYPNPFNPTTKINYELPITNYVSIKVYDVLGNEIETLVNEKQNAGSYSVNFNAASLPSGIYFYKLVTEKFSQTKKMILVK